MAGTLAHDHSWAEDTDEVRACCPDFNPGLAVIGIRCPGERGADGRGVSGMGDLDTASPAAGEEDFDEAAEYDAWVATVADAAAAWSRAVADAEVALGKASGALASLRKLTRDEVSDDDQRDAGVAMRSIRAHLLTLRRIADAQAWRSAQRLGKGS